MPVKESTEEGVPAQWVPPTLYDFRAMPDGPRGYKVGVTKKGHLGSKRKLDAYAEQVELDAANMDTEHTELAPSATLKKRQATKHNNVGQGKVSGRTWKAPGQKASTIRAGSSKKISTSWDRKMKEKAVLKEMRDRKKEAMEERKAAAKALREQKEEAKKRKEENRKRSGLVTQVVSAKTARKMAKSKKGRKKLVVV